MESGGSVCHSWCEDVAGLPKERLAVGYFFFSSRRRHTRCSRDWSSDVCSSDLTGLALPPAQLEQELQRLHYRRAERPERPGIYRVAGARFDVALRPARFADETRDAQLLSIVAGSQGLESLRDSAGHEVPVLRLEPLLIGSIFPIHGEDRIVVTPQEVPTLLPAALKAVEDRKFDSHHGVEPVAMLPALWVNVRARPIQQGGSTPTQPPVRNYF